MPPRKLQIFFILSILLAVSSALGQSNGRASLWEPVDISARDVYNGPGGAAMAPDISRIKYIRKQTGGFRKKYRVEDATGRTWVAKLGVEARPETAAIRLLWA